MIVSLGLVYVVRKWSEKCPSECVCSHSCRHLPPFHWLVHTDSDTHACVQQIIHILMADVTVSSRQVPQLPAITKEVCVCLCVCALVGCSYLRLSLWSAYKSTEAWTYSLDRHTIAPSLPPSLSSFLSHTSHHEHTHMWSGPSPFTRWLWGALCCLLRSREHISLSAGLPLCTWTGS